MVDELDFALAERTGGDPFVEATMAHFQFVMIHTFRVGNDRMARALHTLVLTRAGRSAPENRGMARA